MKIRVCLLLAVISISSGVQASWILKQVRNNKGVRPLGVTHLARATQILPLKIKSIPRFLKEGSGDSKEVYEEILWPQDELPPGFEKLARSSQRQFQRSEVRTIVDQGSAQNRICLTFLGDGYTESEKEKFFSDVARLVDDLFHGKTFQSYQPLFNVYAVFVPSKESGITDVVHKDTAFGLHRDPAGSKRAIEPGDFEALDEAIALAPKTDFPIVVANDDFYGGLGGQYAITTRSVESGKIVLRHELGHNFGSVGEEYDGGSAYFGANNSSSSQVPWKQWLKPGQVKIINDMRFLGGMYLWKNLSQGPVRQKFHFPESTAPFWFEVQISSVGWETLEDVEVLLDGRKLELEGKGTADRSFFNTRKVQDLQAGEHVLEIREVNPDGDNVLAFANLYAYESDYDFSGGVGAFKTYDEGGSLSYRPTHQHCLMRDMLYEFFCSIDQENMWIQFLNRVHLIDSLNVGNESVELQALKIPGLRISWFENGRELPQFENQFKIAKDQLPAGKYEVKVRFENPEVRKSVAGLEDTATFSIP